MEIERKIYVLEEAKKLTLKSEIIETDKLEKKQFVAKTIYTAISIGTEVAAYQGLEPLRKGNVYPRVLGYCNVAQVEYVAEEVSIVKKGDYILNFNCHCSAFVISENEFFIVLPNSQTLHKYTFAYLYHLGYHSLLTAQVYSGHNVGVIGLGTLGYTTMVMACQMNCRVYTFSNQQINNLEGVKIFPKNLNYIDEILAETHQVGLDVVINTSNSWQDWQLAIQLVNKGGVIVNLGFPGRGEPLPNFNPLDPKELYVKNVTIKYLSVIDEKSVPYFYQRFNIYRNLQYIIHLIEAKRINPDEICSEHIHYEQLQEQYEKYIKNRKKQMYSTLVKWQI